MTESRAIWLAVLCLPDLRGAAITLPSASEAAATAAARKSEWARIAEVAAGLAGQRVDPEFLNRDGALDEVRTAPGAFGARYLKSLGAAVARQRGAADPAAAAEDAYTQALLEITTVVRHPSGRAGAPAPGSPEYLALDAAKKMIASAASFLALRAELARRVRNAVRRELGRVLPPVPVGVEPAAPTIGGAYGDREAVWDAVRAYVNARVSDGRVAADALKLAGAGRPLGVVEQLGRAAGVLEAETADDRRRFCLRHTRIIRQTLREIAVGELPGAGDAAVKARVELIHRHVAAVVESLNRVLGE
ncbi:MAG: hypothetical protein U0804_19700 [Gemmataceae bacterium]